MNDDRPFRLKPDRAVPHWGLLALGVLILLGAGAYFLIARSPDVTLTARQDAALAERAFIVDVRARSRAFRLDLPRLGVRTGLHDGRGQFRIRAEDLPPGDGPVTYVLREPWYRPDRSGTVKIAGLAAARARAAPSSEEPEFASQPTPPEPVSAAHTPAPPMATQPSAQAPVVAPSATPPPSAPQPPAQAPVVAPPAAARVEQPPIAPPAPAATDHESEAVAPPEPSSPPPQESETPITSGAPGGVEPTETAKPPVPPRSAWARDRALESELAGRGVTGVRILRHGRSIRLRGTVGSDKALRTVYQLMNDKGFGEVDYGVEVR